MPTSKIGLHDLDPSLFETLSNISGSNSQTKIFPLQVVASEDNQTIFPIGLDTFDAEKDFAFVQSGVTNLFYGADFTIENKNIVLKEGVPAGRTLGIYVLKNVEQINEEDYVSGANLAPGSVTPDKIGGVLPIEKGGTGASNVANVRTNLETNLKTYTSLEQLGITIGEETIDSIMAALPNNSMLMFYVTSEYNTSQYPTVAATCIIYKSLESRTSLTIEGANTGKRWFAEHYTANNNITWTGWKEIFTTNGGTLKGDLEIKSSSAPEIILRHEGAGRYANLFEGGDGNTYLRNSLDDNNRTALYLQPENIEDFGRVLKLQKKLDGTASYYTIFGEHNTELLAPIIQNLLQGGNISMIKSIQRGVITIADGASSQTATINSVNINKAMVSFLGTTYSGASSHHTARLRLTDNTTVTATRSTSNSSTAVSYEVIEFY